MKLAAYIIAAALVTAGAPVAAKNSCKDSKTGRFAACPQMSSTTPTPRHYDCSKAGNKNKAVCKHGGANIAVDQAPAPAAAAPVTTRAATTSTTHATRTAIATNAAGPNGATAKCKDGSYSHSVQHSGACSHHGGVATWY